MPSLSPTTFGATKAITVAAASAVVTIPTPRGSQVMIKSLAANAVAFIAFGDASTVVAPPTGTQQNGYPVLPGTTEMFTVAPGATHIATIGTVANTLYMTSGDGGV